MNDKRILITLMSIIVLSPFGMDIFLPAMPAMASALDTDMTNIQLCIALYLFASGFGQLLAGPLSDKYGRLPLVKAGLVLYITAAIMAAMTSHINLLWISRIGQGLGACAISRCLLIPLVVNIIVVSTN